MNLRGPIERACGGIPGLLRAAVGLLPEGLLIDWIGEGNSFDHEPLIRSAVCCFGEHTAPILGDEEPPQFVEYVFVIEDQLVVMERGRRARHLVLTVVCTREANLAWVLESARQAVQALEESVDLSSFGIAS